MSDLNQIQAFVRVIQQGSFSKAAQLMGVPKSTISHRVQELEKNLGVSLLRRTTRQLTLTPAGEEYFRRALRNGKHGAAGVLVRLCPRLSQN